MAMEALTRIAALAAGSPRAALADAMGLAGLMLLVGALFVATPG
jgi:hypothetical protein